MRARHFRESTGLHYGRLGEYAVRDGRRGLASTGHEDIGQELPLGSGEPLKIFAQEKDMVGIENPGTLESMVPTVWLFYR